MESFGQYLKNERENRNISIDEIAQATKIGPGQLRSIESDDLAALPPITFVKGFIRAYAKHIGIKPDDAVVRFESYLQDIEEDENTSMEFAGNTTFRRDTPHLALVLVVGGVILAMIVLLLLLVRACSSDANTLNPSLEFSMPGGDISVERSSFVFEESFPTDSGEQPGQEVTSPLPTVPPDAYKVRRIAPSFSSLSMPVDGPPEESVDLGGGNTSPP